MNNVRLASTFCSIVLTAAVSAVTVDAAAQTPPEPPPQTTPQPEAKQQPPEPQPEGKQKPAEAQPETQAVPAQTPVDQTNPSFPAPEPPPPSILSQAAGTSYDRRDSLPNVNIYVPEGQASIRIRKLIRNVLFESQIQYKFVTGDISTFLRYKYYARNFTYRLGVFDEVNFVDVGKKGGTSGSSTAQSEFERVRGGLLLITLPRDYNRRYFWLLQDDRLTFGNVCEDPSSPTCKRNVDDRKNNVYTKLGYQYGTQFDERMNAIVGESRGRVTPVLTAFRELGPQKVGFAAALTESSKIGTGDYQYTKLESEVLKRFDLTSTTFFVSRAHLGTFLTRKRRENFGEFDPIERYSIPRYEMFDLGGREALRGVHSKADSQGTHEFHLTSEYFFPIFRNRDYRTFLAHWNTMYGIGYLGAGSVGYGYRDIGKSEGSVVDAGIGTEISVAVRDFDVLLSVLYAHTVHAPTCADASPAGCRNLKGGKLLFSIRTVR